MSSSIRPPERSQTEGYLLSKLPLALNVLEPYIFQSSLDFHHGKFRAGNIKKLNSR